MSLDNYLAKSGEVYGEIRLEISPEQVEQLYFRVKELGYNQYRVFVKEHLADILKYISLSRSQREQKKWVNHPDILLIRLAALQISAATAKLQNGIDQIAYIVGRGSYRQFHAAMADGLAPLLLEYPLARFPFEGCDNPFLS